MFFISFFVFQVLELIACNCGVCNDACLLNRFACTDACRCRDCRNIDDEIDNDIDADDFI